MTRVEVTEWFMDKIRKLQPGNSNIEMYNTYFSSLSDSEFTELMEKLKNGEITLPYYAANLHDKDIGVEDSLKVGDELGIEFFQRLWITDEVSGIKYLTPEKYLILYLPIRRQAQHVSKGKSVAETNTFTDSMTGQAAGPSRTSRLSLPEIMNLEAAGLKNAILELINVRGGNIEAFRLSKRRTLDSGSYTLKEMEELDTRPTATATLHSFLLGMHLSNNV